MTPDRFREFTDGVGDERKDHARRDQVHALGEQMYAWAAEQDRKWHRVAWLLTLMCVGIIVSVGLGYAFLQGQRYNALVDGCERTNQQAEATINLLRDFDAQEDTIRLAKARYPHTPPLAHRDGDRIVEGTPPDYDGPMTCAEFADERVGWPRL
jgi:hypothetical protein